MIKSVLLLSLKLSLFCYIPVCAFAQGAKKQPLALSLEKAVLEDKIKGGWAGQTIGVTYGWHTEFRYQGTFVQDYERIHWEDDYVNRAMREFPGLFDDVYVDLTFMEVLHRLGLEAPVDSLAQAFAKKEYELWHANQVARYNLNNGIPPDKSGHWLSNPHADDIDFQIEADFAGLISPAMPQAATAICEKTGKIIASGDGYYGGLFVAHLYAQAFRTNEIKPLIEEALQVVPTQSKFYQCIRDVLAWHAQEPSDWKETWWQIQKKWSEDHGCPNFVFHPLDIDAKLNAAYVVMALLYGNGDFFHTMDIATRAGQDSDCNPATACGILGTMLGYSYIPHTWMETLKKAEGVPFSYSSYSLSDVYRVNVDLAMASIVKAGGMVDKNRVTIPYQKTFQVPFEENFAGHYPKERVKVAKTFPKSYQFDFEGCGIVVSGHLQKVDHTAIDKAVQIGLYIDGQLIETANLFSNANMRRPELCWRYQLSDKKHRVEIKLLAEEPGYQLHVTDYLVYVSHPQIAIQHRHD
jgi:hypothetical protein